MTKSEQTRSLIVDTALRLFAERGYDKTTMRAIATEAGLSVGNAYYYFGSKEHLIQGFYDRIQELHFAACAEILATETDFETRMRRMLLAWVDIAEPYRAFGAQFFRNAADPASPLSPFSVESTEVRNRHIALHSTVLNESTAKVDGELREVLPELMWLYHMTVVLYWVHDRSPHSATTRMLISRTTPLIARLVGLSRLKVFRTITRDGVQLFRDLGWFPSPPKPE
ncbi:TetR/AcrR family transcriptional regulator [Pseudonocardiaceae bacterium YIM PH 21723]|nr:TetR/AcrR family transcriptional regulator [Pseudonocardiaceae bacterium YIM PH 21723]